MQMPHRFKDMFPGIFEDNSDFYVTDLTELRICGPDPETGSGLSIVGPVCQISGLLRGGSMASTYAGASGGGSREGEYLRANL